MLKRREPQARVIIILPNLAMCIVHSTSEATLGAMLQAEHGNASATSPQNDGEGKREYTTVYHTITLIL